MAISNGYCSSDLNSANNLAALKARLDIGDTIDDSILESVIEATSRKIDEYCSTRFYAETLTLYFTAEFADMLEIPDLLSATSLKTDEDGDATFENTWATTDYFLLPLNAQSGTVKLPYNAIEINPNGDYGFPVGIRKGVEIAGSWGAADGSTITVPAQVVEAALLLGQKLFLRKDSPFGVTSFTDFGKQILKIPAIDGEVAQLLNPFRRAVGF